MAGDYFRAKQRTGGFAGALQPIMDYFLEKKQKEEQKQNLIRMLNAFTKSRGEMSDIKTGADVGFRDAEMTSSSDGNVLVPKGREPEDSRPEIPIEDPEYDILGDYMPSAGDRQGRMQKKSDEFFIDEMMNPNVDAERLDVLGGMLEGDVGSLTPPVGTVMERDPTKRYVERFPGGEENILQESTPKKGKGESNVLGYTEKDGQKFVKYGRKNDDGTETVTKLTPFGKSANRFEEEYPDVSKQLGRVNTVIKGIEDLQKSESIYDEGTKTRTYTVIDDQGDTENWTQEQMDKQRDFKKQEAIEDITQVVQQRELDIPGGAIETIRDNVQKRSGKDIKDVDIKTVLKEVKAFIRANPSYAAERAYLIAYFKLFKL